MKLPILYLMFALLLLWQSVGCGKPVKIEMSALPDSLQTVQLVPYRAKNGKWGLSTLAHKVVLPCEYENIKILPNVPELVFIYADKYWYAYNRKGERVITEGFESVRENGGFLIFGMNDTVSTLRDRSGKRVILSGYKDYDITADWVFAKTRRVNQGYIFDTTGKQIDTTLYQYRLIFYNNNRYTAVSNLIEEDYDKKRYAIFSINKGRISDYIFSRGISNASDYWVTQSIDSGYIYINLAGQSIYKENYYLDKNRVTVTDSLLLLIDKYNVDIRGKTFRDKAISYTGNIYSIVYQCKENPLYYDNTDLFFSLDSGKIYRQTVKKHIWDEYVTINPALLSKEEVEMIVMSIPSLSDTYVVRKNSKFGVWSAQSKQMIIPAKYDTVYPVIDKRPISSTNNRKYDDILLFCTATESIIYDPLLATQHTIKALNKGDSLHIFAQPKSFVSAILADIYIIRDIKKDISYFYNLKTDKIIGECKGFVRRLNAANEAEKVIFERPKTGMYRLGFINMDSIRWETTAISVDSFLDIDYFWTSNLFASIGERNIDSIIYRNIKGVEVAVFSRGTHTFSPYGFINDKFIYDTQLNKSNYVVKGYLDIQDNLIIDSYMVQTGNNPQTQEELYIDWSGKPYAEE